MYAASMRQQVSYTLYQHERHEEEVVEQPSEREPEGGLALALLERTGERELHEVLVEAARWWGGGGEMVRRWWGGGGEMVWGDGGEMVGR